MKIQNKHIKTLEKKSKRMKKNVKTQKKKLK